MQTEIDLPKNIQSALSVAIPELQSKLGENLYSCLLYGSAVRGGLVSGISDLNIVIVLNQSDPSSHDIIAEVVSKFPVLDPFVLGRKGIERSLRSFAPKFVSIQRNYKVLHGEDFLKTLQIDKGVLKFLTEQAVRNQRLRLIHAYIMFGRDRRRYTNHLLDITTNMIANLSEILRLEGTSLAKNFVDRIPELQQHLGSEAEVFRFLLDVKDKPRRLAAAEITSTHQKLCAVFNKAVSIMESKWDNKSLLTN